jgi:serine/threonine protein kinase
MLFAENRGGTPGYMAPEIMRGGAISPQADVYSYAATMSHLMTGRRPKNGDNLDPASAGDEFLQSGPLLRSIVVHQLILSITNGLP